MLVVSWTNVIHKKEKWKHIFILPLTFNNVYKIMPQSLDHFVMDHNPPIPARNCPCANPFQVFFCVKLHLNLISFCLTKHFLKTLILKDILSPLSFSSSYSTLFEHFCSWSCSKLWLKKGCIKCSKEQSAYLWVISNH